MGRALSKQQHAVKCRLVGVAMGCEDDFLVALKVRIAGVYKWMDGRKSANAWKYVHWLP